MKETNYIKVGRILGIHGTKGLVKIRSYLENPSDIFNFNELFINEIKFKGINFRFKKKTNFIVEFVGIKSLDQARKFINFDIFINMELLPKLKDKEFYLKDLINFIVKSESGKVLGKVRDFYDFGAGLIIEIQNKKKMELVPFSDEFIVKIDNKSHFIIITSNIEEYLGV